MKKFASIFALVLVLFFLLGACASQEAEEPVAQEPAAEEQATEVPSKVGGHLMQLIALEPDTLDMQKTTFANSAAVVSKLTGGLLAKDYKGNLIPYLAESWESSADGLTWTFKLREGVKFHNGDPLTAKDWVYTFMRVKDPNFPATATAYNLESVENVEALDDYTLMIHLKEPFFWILDTLAIGSYQGVFSQRFIEETGDQYGLTVEGVIGVGPYIFKEWVQDEKIIIERNPDFNWGPEVCDGCNTGPYYIETIEFRIQPDQATQLATLEAGEAGIAAIPPQNLQVILDTGEYNLLVAPSQLIYYVIFNLSDPLMQNEALRQALNYSVDRDTYNQIIAGGIGIKMLGPIAQGTAGYWPEIEEYGLDYDPEKAREKFIEAGLTYGEDGLLYKDDELFELTFSTISVDSAIKAAELLQNMWLDVGLTVNITSEEFGLYNQNLSAGNYVFGVTGTSYPNADILYLTFHTGNSSTMATFASFPELDEILDKTRTETDPVKQQEYVRQAQLFIVEHALMLPTISINDNLAVSKDIEGVVTNSNGVFLQDAYFTNLE